LRDRGSRKLASLRRPARACADSPPRRAGRDAPAARPL